MQNRNAINPEMDTNGDFKKMSCSIEVAGIDVVLHPSGVAYLPDEATLIVSDLHLEKGSHFAERQKRFIPPYDTGKTLANLALLLSEFAPKRVISLGDSFHDENGPNRMASNDADVLKGFVEGADWLWISGNHDPALPKHLGGTFINELELGGLTFRHEPSLPPSLLPANDVEHQEDLFGSTLIEDKAPKTISSFGEVAGHLHPCARIRGRGGRHVRRPCFITDGKRIIMPAFGAFTGGLNIRDTAFDGLFNVLDVQVYMMGSDRLFPIDTRVCLGG